MKRLSFFLKPAAWLVLTLAGFTALSGFYAHPESSADPFYRLKSRFKGTYLAREGNGVSLSSATNNLTTWTLERVNNTDFYHLKHGMNHYLHLENGRPEVGVIQSGWWSAQWSLESVGEGSYVRIKNRWNGTYLHTERGSLEAGTIQKGWWSAQWLRESVPMGTLPTATRYERATPAGGIGCGRGTFFDPIDGGTCWTCPEGYQRTVYAVKSGQACEQAGGEVFAQATRHGRGYGPLGTNCADGQFWDPNGYCYSCPSGYNRTGYPVTSAKACSKRVKASFAAATNVREARECPSGAFFDIGTNKCWTCPDGYRRTVSAVTSDQACERQ
jgi:hypothetical protein